MSQDISPEIIKKTQKNLGKFVKKPPLTEKLLTKPPFRFLHDIVKSVIKETGFLKGLFTESELKSENITEKNAKIAFLNKLIDAVKTLTNTDLEVKASKIVAGLEPTNTNLLLQCIGKALESNVDSSEYISHLTAGHDVPKKKPKESKTKSSSKTNLIKDGSVRNKADETPKTKKASTPKNKVSSRVDQNSNTPKGQPNNKKNEDKKKRNNKQVKPNQAVSPKENTNDHDVAARNNDELAHTADNDKILVNKTVTEVIDEPLEALGSKEVDSGISINDEPSKTSFTQESEKETGHTNEERARSSASLVRPKSARPKSGDRTAQKSALTVHREEIMKPLDMTASRPIPKSALLRPPSARPPSARPAAPRLQARPDSAIPLGEPVPLGGGVSVIVEGTDDMADEEETVVIEEVDRGADVKPNATALQNENKGQLVEQILEQIGEEEARTDAKRKVEMEWESEALAKGGVAKEIAQLRNLIQTVTKTASPLGKLMSYLHEDIEAMYSELQMWMNTRKQLFNEINKQKKLNEESTKPLLSHLSQLQEEIKKQEQEIIDMQNNVQRNDIRIKELLSNK